MTGGCHCGAVNLTLDHKPDYVNFCDCSLCAKSGAVWGYFDKSQVEITGSTSCYRRHDYPEPVVEMQFCANCGTTTHWFLTEHQPGDRMGVNMRIFEPSELAGIEARVLDGRNWFGKAEAAHRREPGVLGDDVFI